MTKQEKIRFYYQIFLGVFTVVIGALFIFGAANIYGSGPVTEDGISVYYSRSIVWSRLKWILIPTFVYILAVIGGAVMLIFPERKQKPAKTSPEKTYSRLKKKVSFTDSNESIAPALEEISKAEKIRKIVYLCGAAICVICAVICIVALCQTQNFSGSDINGEVISFVSVALPCVIVAFAACIAIAAWDRVQAKKLLPSVKSVVAAQRGARVETKQGKVSAALEKNQDKVIWTVRAAVLVLGVTFLILGIFNNGAQDVLAKAINICTECIGLG